MINRRTLIAAIAASALGRPFIARAQQAGKIYRLGILGNVPPSDSQGARLWGALTQGHVHSPAATDRRSCHEHMDVGGLVFYGPSMVDNFRRAAVYVDKILKGAKPGELPVEQPTTFELVINLRTAKMLNLTIPPSLLLRANQVLD